MGAQAIAKSSSCIKSFRLGGRKNRTGIGAHPPGPLAREIPVISRVEAGYVRSSELPASDLRGGLLALAVSGTAQLGDLSLHEGTRNIGLAGYPTISLAKAREEAARILTAGCLSPTLFPTATRR